MFHDLIPYDLGSRREVPTTPKRRNL
jgi:hypothetical protein